MSVSYFFRTGCCHLWFRFNGHYSIKIKIYFFQVNMQLRIEYLRITNQTLYSFSSTVKWWMSAAHSVFKQSVQTVHQLQLHTLQPTVVCTAHHNLPVSSTRRQIVCNVLKLQILPVKLALITLAPNPCSQSVCMCIMSLLLSPVLAVYPL